MKITLWNINNILNKKIWKLRFNSVNSSFYFKYKRKANIDEFIIEYNSYIEKEKDNKIKLEKEIKEAIINKTYKPYIDMSWQNTIPNN